MVAGCLFVFDRCINKFKTANAIKIYTPFPIKPDKNKAGLPKNRKFAHESGCECHTERICILGINFGE